MGLMSARDFDNYTDLFQIMTSYLRPPDLLVYLRARVPTLVGHIQSRGREFESTIRIEYLERLNEHYEDWISRYSEGPKIIIDIDELDFVNVPDDQREMDVDELAGGDPRKRPHGEHDAVVVRKLRHGLARDLGERLAPGPP